MWLAIYIPALPLQAFSRALVESGPVAIYERDAKRNRIVASNKKAAQLGNKFPRPKGRGIQNSANWFALCIFLYSCA